MDGAEALRMARESADRALAIDPDDGDALVVRRRSAPRPDHDPSSARAAFEKVLALNPSCGGRAPLLRLVPRRPPSAMPTRSPPPTAPSASIRCVS